MIMILGTTGLCFDSEACGAIKGPVIRPHHASRNKTSLLPVCFVVDAEAVATKEVKLAAVVGLEPLLLGSGVRWGSGAVVGLHFGSFVVVFVD